MSSDSTVLEVRVIRPSTRLTVASPTLLWQYRDLIAQFAKRDLRVRYKQTILGVLWVVLQPLAAAGVFTFVFSFIAEIPSGGDTPYFVVALSGTMVWTAFVSILTRMSVSLVSNAPLLSKVYFPRLALPFSSLISTSLDLAVSAVVLAAVLVMSGVVPGSACLLAPLWIIAAMALGAGSGLLAAALTVSYRDVQYVLPVALQLLLYALPVAYPAGAVPERLRWLVDVNPLTALIEGFRWSVLGDTVPPPSRILYAAASTVVTLLVGLAAFGRMERRFADVI